ncbi:MAG TPA: 3-phosphoshikimate 1-carboxyvinyltransferase [Longimicrobiaceae bacterium]|nr:3-phosphoshikimate 1-carboxyvinyltransferase [Longimicrobiaceae bacterium]
MTIDGVVSVPGDKSISHRALMLAAVATGESRIRGILTGEDCRSTASVLRALGCPVPDITRQGELVISSGGLSAWHEPGAPLDCGNSGTTVRLMMGLLASRPFCTSVTGDESLRARPMRRITDPLQAMGATIHEHGPPDRLPVEICGGGLSTIHHDSPKASAQIKSAILLAALAGGVRVSVREPAQSRDHTERMLEAMGVSVRTGPAVAGGWEVEVDPLTTPLTPLDITVPGDPSSAAFLLALTLLARSGELVVRGVGMNTTRTGFFDALRRMGASLEILNQQLEGGEPVGDLVIRPSSLAGIEIGADEVPAMIDEIPILAVLAARAEGVTIIRGAGELRAKETDRIAALAMNLRAIGVDVEELPDGLIIEGSDRPLSGRILTFGDHRIAMAFGVLGQQQQNDIDLDDRACADVSFPGFWKLLAELSR